MAKKSQKHHVQYEKDHSGCIWGLVSIFDFRHSRTDRKLISDKRHGNRHSGTGYIKNRFDVLSNLDENRQESLDCKETMVLVGGDAKPIAKELMEVEMVGEEEIKKEINHADLESKVSDSVHEGQKKKRRRKKTKSWTKSGNTEAGDPGVPENTGSELSCIQISVKQSTKDVTVDNMMEEFYKQIHQKGNSFEEHDRNSEGWKLDEAIREFIKQKVIDNKQLTVDEDMQELMDIFHIASPDKGLFLKLMQDPHSPLVKYTRSWRDTQNGESDSLPALNLCEHESGESEELINYKQRSFFGRLVKSKEKNLLTENFEVNASKRIIILKPSPTGSQSSEIENSFGSSSECHNVVRNKCTNKKTSSYFSFTKFRGKLRNAMGKEGNAMSTDTAENRYQSDCRKIEDGDKTKSSDNIGKSSPGKDHFFIERFAKPPTHLQRDDPSSKTKDFDMSHKRGPAGNSGKKLSHIYIEARRHLSEMLSMEEGGADSSSRPVPRTLGRILSLPEYNLSPINSPKMDLLYKTAVGCSGHDKDQMVKRGTESLKEESEECRPELATRLEVETSADDQDSEPKTRDATPNTKNELTCDSAVETTCPVTDEMDPEDDMEVHKATTDVCLEDSSSLYASCQPSSTSTKYGQNDDTSEVQGSYEDNQMPSPESPPPSSPWSNEKAEEKEASTCIQGGPSPVSLLEPLLVEDGISPERTICKHEPQLPVQPLCIQFDECEPSPSTPQGTCPKICQDKEPVIEYVSAVLQASDLRWDELYMGSFSSGHLLKPSLFDKLEFLNELHNEQQLLFDIINHVLREVYECYFAFSLCVAFVKPGIRPLPNPKSLTNEVCKGVSWHLFHLPQPCTLDQIVRKDMEKSDSWLDLRSDVENIGFGIAEAILDDLLDETLLICLHECPVEDIFSGGIK